MSEQVLPPDKGRFIKLLAVQAATCTAAKHTKSKGDFGASQHSKVCVAPEMAIILVKPGLYISAHLASVSVFSCVHIRTAPIFVAHQHHQQIESK